MPANYFPSLTSLYSFTRSSILSFFTPKPLPEQISFSNRKRSKFASNKTASVALPDTMTAKQTFQNNSIAKRMLELHAKQKETTDSAEIEKIVLEKVELVDEQIKEHASRRVDLFFYLLIAVYNKNVSVKKDGTTKQNGGGSIKSGTQACHCSLFPNIRFESLANTWNFFKSSSFTLAGTYFEEALNMTMELPLVVNGFDGSLEGKKNPTKYIISFTETLNKTAKGEIDPKEGMQEFFKTMHDFFIDYHNMHFKKENAQNFAAKKKVWEYQLNGTFLGNCNPVDYSVTDQYLYSMLRLNEVDQILLKKDSKLISGFYKKIQNEIINSKPVESINHSKKQTKGK